MSSTLRLGLAVTTLCLVGPLLEPGVSAQSTIKQGSSRVIIVREQESRLSPLTPVLELIRQRLPVRVLPGRFATPDGLSDVCVSTRRLRQRAIQASTSETLSELPRCETIVTYVNGARVSDANHYLSMMSAQEFESIELMTRAEAQGRLGMSAGNDEVLVLWSKGRGPYAPARE